MGCERWVAVILTLGMLQCVSSGTTSRSSATDPVTDTDTTTRSTTTTTHSSRWIPFRVSVVCTGSELALYVDGHLIHLKRYSTRGQPTSISVLVPPTSKVIAVHCKQTFNAGKAQIAVYTSHGGVSGKSWRCSPDYHAGWATVNFNDRRRWSPAYVTELLGRYSTIPASAKGIWSNRYSSNAYCRTYLDAIPDFSPNTHRVTYNKGPFRFTTKFPTDWMNNLPKVSDPVFNYDSNSNSGHYESNSSYGIWGGLGGGGFIIFVVICAGLRCGLRAARLNRAQAARQEQERQNGGRIIVTRVCATPRASSPGGAGGDTESRGAGAGGAGSAGSRMLRWLVAREVIARTVAQHEAEQEIIGRVNGGMTPDKPPEYSEVSGPPPSYELATETNNDPDTAATGTLVDTDTAPSVPASGSAPQGSSISPYFSPVSLPEGPAPPYSPPRAVPPHPGSQVNESGVSGPDRNTIDVNGSSSVVDSDRIQLLDI